MRELSTIQKREKLNDVYASDEPVSNGGASHSYNVYKHDENHARTDLLLHVQFQKGPRKETDAVSGALDTDLLEIVRDRLKSFQTGQFSCRENACALTHIEEALLWLNKRTEDRIERGVLGTNQK